MSGTIRRADNILAAALDDTLLMMSVEKGLYIGISGVGPRIWELLEHPTAEAAVIAALLAEYEVDADTCATQVAAFLAGLRERGLLVDG
ncbi:MAG TPA: PqqD family peptide modification chaperone [Magnetospirillum sp.]|nr:PqqD family peptide modification chaperone [Magnetospirillum sp.]